MGTVENGPGWVVGPLTTTQRFWGIPNRLLMAGLVNSQPEGWSGRTKNQQDLEPPPLAPLQNSSTAKLTNYRRSLKHRSERFRFFQPVKTSQECFRGWTSPDRRGGKVKTTSGRVPLSCRIPLRHVDGVPGRRCRQCSAEVKPRS